MRGLTSLNSVFVYQLNRFSEMEKNLMRGFDASKTIQAAACLLNKEPGKRTNYMRLLKLLYLSDRLSLQQRLMPICGDTPYAMKRGPVPSTTLDMIKGRDPESSRWANYISTCGYDVEIVKDPGNTDLSRAELNILDKISTEHRDRDEWELVEWCHENLPEFQKNDPAKLGKKRIQISLDDVLKAVNRLEDKDQVTDQINERLYFRKLFKDRSPV